MCSTEEAVQALLDCLVDPMLSSKCSVSDLNNEEKLAKQVYATVILYNYYQRKQCPQLKFLDFENFCKLSVVLKPSLLPYFSHIKGTDASEEQEVILSLTEKMVNDACVISTDLDAEKPNPCVERLPIAKVAIFLVDSRMKNCFLQFGTLFEGVWSLIEKVAVSNRDDAVRNIDSGRLTRNKKSVVKKPSKSDHLENESTLWKLAVSAIVETVGISESGIDVVESHITYSISHKKSAVCFYIMRSTNPYFDDRFLDSIEDLMTSMAGPLIVKTSFGWAQSTVVEYCSILPYHNLLLDWYSRRRNNPRDSLSLQNTENDIIQISLPKQNGKLENFSTIVACANGQKGSDSSLKSCGSKRKDLIRIRSPKDDNYTENSSENALNGLEKRSRKADESEKKMCENSSMSELRGETTDIVLENNVQDIVNCEMPHDDERSLLYSPVCDNQLAEWDKVRDLIVNKDDELSKAAVDYIFSKRDKLSLHQREIEDQIAQCDKSIHTILSGGKNSLQLKMQTIIESCCVSRVRSVPIGSSCNPTFELQSGTPAARRLLPESSTDGEKNPCQTLDSLCVEKGWKLPIYHVSACDGGFEAEAILKEKDLQRNVKGEVKEDPIEARSSAARELLRIINM